MDADGKVRQTFHPFARGGVVTAVVPAMSLLDSINRLAEAHEHLDIRFGLPDGWIRCSDLLDDHGGFDAWRARLGDWMVGEYGSCPERSTAGYVLSWYLYVPGYLSALMFHCERRVPSLRPEDLAFRIAEPRPHPDGIALLDSSFVCLPSDPAAGLPGTTVVRDEQALAAILRGRFAAHATRFVASYAPTVRFGKRTLWAAATDALDSALWLAGQYGGDEGAGVADASLVLPEKLEPFTSASTMFMADGEWTRRRESCCFHYLLDQEPCSTCPRSTRGFRSGSRDFVA
jgi:hypothetical protein